MSHALIADLGGTNARFAIAPIGQYQPQEVTVLPCKEYATFFDALDHFVEHSSIDMASIDAVVLAIAGPVNQKVIRFSNNPWHFSREEIENYFGNDRPVALLNDFDAVGHCLEIMDKEQLVQIGKGESVDPAAPAWVLGAGTGLGVACVIPREGKSSLILPGEGGHVDLPSCNEQEDYILQFLRKRHGRVSAERVLSGMGLENIFEALAHKDGIHTRLTAPEIGQAISRGDVRAIAALEQFFVYLGRVAGDLVLNVESRGGVYIAGGIVPRYLEAFKNSLFRNAMQEKGRMKDFVAPIPVFVLTADYPGLMGCANFASYLVAEAAARQ